MRVGMISDVHANLVALETVLDELDRRGVDRIYNAGDLVGYYPYPNETLDLLKRRKVISIRGNHDRSVINAIAQNMNPMATSAVIWTAARLVEENISFLRRLPEHLDFHLGPVRCSLHHGSPIDPDEYIFEEQANQELLDASHSKIVILGHTHVPFVKHTERGTIVNPGSVGQPRDGDPRSSFMIYDTTKNVCENVRIAYDIKIVQKAVYDAGLPRSLADRLAQGW